MISVTGTGLSRARLGDHFSTYSRFAFRAFLDRNDQPSRTFRASTRDYSSFVGVTRDALGLEDELLLFPVIVVDAGAVEALDHFGGAGTGLDGLEDAEGAQGAATFVVKAIHVNDEGGLTCPEITPRWAGCPPRTRPSTISGTSHLHSEGKL